MLCAKCQSNYYLDLTSNECLPLDVESNPQIEKDAPPNLDEEANPGLNGFMIVLGNILVGITLAALGLLGCKII